jgi:hypothetical protein
MSLGANSPCKGQLLPSGGGKNIVRKPDMAVNFLASMPSGSEAVVTSVERLIS